ncbi:hypothetical protein RIF29_28359 [Crotalaria pallida]|uniref:Glucose-methanol-choline oxidoreductase N-terminal domain-containing protein n=1 Tax=Crotalaria pallida TaxID=3830 RepID=A0AAN9I6I6_CROPI
MLYAALTKGSNSYAKFVVNATELPIEDYYYDYIIIGGGTTACPLAATLSRMYRVLLLERGGLPNIATLHEQGFMTTLLNAHPNPTYLSPHSPAPAQSFTSEDGVPNIRAYVLGGSSAINAGFYSRARQDFFTGFSSGLFWDIKLVNDSYQWVEKDIVFKPTLKTWQSAFRDALLEADLINFFNTGVGPYNGFALDHASGTKIGGSTFDNTGRRHSSADLLSNARAPNIIVGVYATVERILLASSSSSKQFAIGVIYRDNMGRSHHAFVRQHGEVILSAGAIGSPQLLMLSGIGHTPHLTSLGIPVAHHNPFVGQFLYDNPRNGIAIIPSLPLDHSLIQVVGITDSGYYIESISNAIGTLPVASLIAKIAGPVSSGFLRLASTDVNTHPIVRFNYFNNKVDVERCVNGTRKIGEVLRSRALNDFKFNNLFGGKDFRFVGPMLPIDQTNYFHMADFCQRTVSTIWHYHGGCVVGKVVDHDLKVFGIESLRVVDGSVFGVSPGTNPQATLMMLGR